MAALVLVVYFTALAFLAAIGLHRVGLTIRALGAKRRPLAPPPRCEQWPELVVQLPIYNEALVAERLLGAALALRYPRDRLLIQILDDSTDETSAIVERVVAAALPAGARLQHLRRTDRRGYKAGALAHGLEHTAAPLVAIFDADFVPPPDFLLSAVPALLADPRCGLVQGRWGHLNRDSSLLTRAQAVLLDAHFGIEHEGRAAAGFCFNFNGTAGVWRRAAIEEAGGWSSATITEDLDLSYRAQLAGWRFRYLDRVSAPAELPESWAAFRSQQARWVKGGVQTFRRHAAAVAAKRGWSWARRLEALLHLGGNLAYLPMALVGVLLPIAVVLRGELGWRIPGGEPLLAGLDLAFLGGGTLAMVLFYAASMASAPGRGRWIDLPVALALGCGLSLTNARQVFGAFIDRGGDFVRTPKRGAAQWQVMRAMYRSPASALAWAELALAAMHLTTIAYALAAERYGPLPFLALYGFGLGALGLGSIKERLADRGLVAPQMATSNPRAG
jgi:cellulose synthase/poly-beta-1,6-N-acetylglucosamine synthase-like glycosyltransferase